MTAKWWSRRIDDQDSLKRVRPVPRTLFMMPTLSIITGTTGWFLAKDLSLLDVPWP
jgi:hypothetical protein